MVNINNHDSDHDPYSIEDYNHSELSQFIPESESLCSESEGDREAERERERAREIKISLLLIVNISVSEYYCSG